MSRPALVLGLGAAALLAALALRPRTPASGLTGPVGRWFSWEELTASATAQRRRLDNTPPPEAQQALRTLVEQVLDPLREQLGRPVRVTSGYRGAEINRAVGGAPHSQHVLGEAVDLVVDGLTSRQLASALLDAGLPFDQLIAYAPERGGHVHVSVTTRRPNRMQVLWAPAGGDFVGA